MNGTGEIPSSMFSDLDIRSKCALFIQFMTWTLLFNHPFCHGVMAVMIIGTGLAAGMPLKQMFSRLTPLLPLFIMIMLFTGFSGTTGFVHPQYKIPIFTLWDTLHLTRGGMLLGITFLLRLVNMVVFTHILLATTPLDDFITLFATLRLSPTLSFLITTALRFVPALDKKRELIITAQQARGIDLNEGSRLRRFKVRIAIMIPLIVNAIVIADQLTMALMNRGFGYRKKWTIMNRLSFTTRDGFVIIFSILSLGGAIAVRYHNDWGII